MDVSPAGEEAEGTVLEPILGGLCGQGGSVQDLFKTLWRDDSGQDTTEYVLLVLLVALAVTAGMLVLATEINEAFSEAGSVLDSAPIPVMGS